MEGCHLHDPTAVIATIRPDLFGFETCPIEVPIDGERVGETQKSTESSRADSNWAAKVEAESVKHLFFETIGDS